MTDIEQEARVAAVVSEWRENKRTLTWRPEFTRALDAFADALLAAFTITEKGAES